MCPTALSDTSSDISTASSDTSIGQASKALDTQEDLIPSPVDVSDNAVGLHHPIPQSEACLKVVLVFVMVEGVG